VKFVCVGVRMVHAGWLSYPLPPPSYPLRYTPCTIALPCNILCKCNIYCRIPLPPTLRKLITPIGILKTKYFAPQSEPPDTPLPRLYHCMIWSHLPFVYIPCQDCTCFVTPPNLTKIYPIFYQKLYKFYKLY
jgi:hypothetical protein